MDNTDCIVICETKEQWDAILAVTKNPRHVKQCFKKGYGLHVEPKNHYYGYYNSDPAKWKKNVIFMTPAQFLGIFLPDDYQITF